jgi:PD-(D/E)XK nuclease superfamily protein
VIYSYTQISQYLRCPRSYRHRYLDGWIERETRANLIFGRCFEKALAAYFRREDCTAVLFKEWGAYRDTALDYGKGGESWDKLVHQGVHLLEMFARDDRIRIPHPEKNLQLKMLRALPNDSEFVAYIDAIGELDGQHFLMDWKTTTSRYPEEPEGVLSLDPQLTSYSWISGIPDVALVVFVRKRFPEIQYLKASITDEQRQTFGRLVSETVGQIEAGQFLPHSGIRFPMNGCTSCAHLGLCLGRQPLIDSKLIRRPGAAELDWLDQFEE